MELRGEDIVDVGGIRAKFYFQLEHKPSKAFVFIRERVSDPLSEDEKWKYILYRVDMACITSLSRPKRYYWQVI